MTRLIFLPEDHSLIQQDDYADPAELARLLNSGTVWPGLPAGGPWQAAVVGKAVIAIPSAVSSGPGGIPPTLLSPRQWQVLQAMVEGLSSGEIACRLGIAVRTVNFHAGEIQKRLGTSTRLETVGRAVALGLCVPEFQSKERG